MYRKSLYSIALWVKRRESHLELRILNQIVLFKESFPLLTQKTIFIQGFYCMI